MTSLGNNKVDLCFEQTYKKSMTIYKRKTTNKEEKKNHKFSLKKFMSCLRINFFCYFEGIFV
jgi:hypothetical protein